MLAQHRSPPYIIGKTLFLSLVLDYNPLLLTIINFFIMLLHTVACDYENECYPPPHRT
jgi:hypothetical protein